MKRCPQCNQTYADDALNFCLADGTPLLAVTGDVPTVVIPRPDKPSKRRGLMWAGLVVFFIFAAAGLAAAVLIWKSSRNDNERTKVNVSTAQTPTSTPKPKSTPATAAPVEPSPAGSSTTQIPDNDDKASDEITPIAWDTTAGGFKGETGKTYMFECPEGGTPHGIYGNEVYTDFSSICTAAVHAGIINLDDGGKVTIEYRPGRPIYGTTTRHNIKSNTTGEHSRSIVVR